MSRVWALLLATLSCSAQGAEVCYPPEKIPETTTVPEDKTIVLDADEVEAKENEWIHLHGTVNLTQGNRKIHSDELRYVQTTGEGSALGHVEIRQPGLEMEGSVANFDTLSERAQINAATYRMLGSPGHGGAEQIKVLSRDRIELRQAKYSTCPEGNETWWFKARHIILDKANNEGEAYGATLRFMGLPLGYLPYINFSLGARKTGILAPSYSTSDRRGVALSIPFYWNIAPNLDLTVTPHYMSKRGLQMQGEFRYLTQHHDGSVKVEYLNRDDLTGEPRGMLTLKQQGEFAGKWWSELDYKGVSDQLYVRDMGGGISSTSVSVLERRLEFSQYGEALGIRLGLQSFQPLGNSLAGKSPLYRRAPQLLVHNSTKLAAGLRADVDAEMVYFDRDSGVTATRLDARPQLRYRKESGWGFIEPRLAWRATQYLLNGQHPDDSGQPMRSLPIASLDSGVVIERSYRKGEWLHTVEPRLYYLYVPYRDQSGLIRAPDGSRVMFDSALAELSYEQQFNTNRYLGADLQGDANQMNWGIQTRLINTALGQERVTAAIGQTVYLSDAKVALPGQTPVKAGRSDLIGNFTGRYADWRLELNGQWRENQSTPSAGNMRLSFRKGQRNLLMALNYRENLVKQAEFSGGMPIGSHWKVMGHLIQSLTTNQILQQAVGFEYSDCCWAVRLAARRYTNGLSGYTSQTFGIQLEFKGLANVGAEMPELASMR